MGGATGVEATITDGRRRWGGGTGEDRALTTDGRRAVLEEEVAWRRSMIKHMVVLPRDNPTP
jgi:hypothetical protein